MDTSELRPTTLDGIKRLARTIKKETGCKHMLALERAAQQAGYAHYHAARKALPPQRHVPVSCEIDATDAPQAGAEPAQPKPVSELPARSVEVVWKRSRLSPG